MFYIILCQINKHRPPSNTVKIQEFYVIFLPLPIYREQCGVESLRVPSVYFPYR